LYSGGTCNRPELSRAIEPDTLTRMMNATDKSAQAVTAEDLLRISYLSRISFAPNGRLAAYCRHRATEDQDRYESTIWLYRPEDDVVTRLTTATEGLGYTWLQDSDAILFWGVRTEKDRQRREAGDQFTQCYRIPVNGGEATPSFRLPVNAKDIRQIGSGEFLVSATYDPVEESLQEIADERERKKRRDQEKDCVVLEELPFWSNGAGFVSGKRTRVYRYREANGTLDPISADDVHVQSFEYDAQAGIVVCVERPVHGTMRIEDRIVLHDLKAGGAAEVSFERPMGIAYACPAGRGDVLYVGSDMARYGLNGNKQIYRYDPAARTHRCLTEGRDISIGNSINSDCRFSPGPRFRFADTGMLYLTTEGSNSYLNRMDREGSVVRLAAGAGSVDEFDVHHHTCLIIALRDGAPHELYRVDERDERRITSHNGWLIGERSVRQPEPLEVGGENVPTISGWVMLPHNYDAGGRYPAILQIHGGPKTAYGDVFFHEMQYLAGAGYVVFFCNPRGSDGRGNDFADIRGSYGTVDYEDIMRFTDAVLTQYPSIAPDRLGVAGGSYGGFMTNWIIGHTDRFRAAVSQRSIAHWQSFFGTTDIGYYFCPDQTAATPWESPERLAEQSPLTYAERVSTPTLFIHSDQDYRCWMAEALQMFTALRLRGVETRLCLFRGENHELSRSGKPSQRLRRLEEIRRWFDEHLGDEAHAP
jgi:dipeptidyl aminopeptidase/acylaminoacyl peptidase